MTVGVLTHDADHDYERGRPLIEQRRRPRSRLVPEAVAFETAFAAAGKPIAAICHDRWTLVEAGLVAGPVFDAGAATYPAIWPQQAQ